MRLRMYILAFIVAAAALSVGVISAQSNDLQTTSTTPPAPPVDPAVLRNKKSILHDLTMKNLRANREYGIKLNLTGVEDYCLKPETSVLDCSKEAQDLDDRLNSQMNQAELLQQQQRANDLRDGASTDASNNTTVIQQTEQNIYVKPRGTYSPHYPSRPLVPRDPPRDPRTNKPIFTPGSTAPSKTIRDLGTIESESSLTIETR